MQTLSVKEMESVNGGAIMGAVFVGFALGTLLVSTAIAWLDAQDKKREQKEREAAKRQNSSN